MASNTKTGRIGLRRSLPFYSIMIAWPVLQFCVFYIGVNFNSILLAFKEYTNETDFTWSFHNFKVWLDFSDSTYGAYIPKALVVSLKAYAISLVVGVPLGLFFSYYIFKKMPLSGFFRVVLFIPTIVSSIVLVSMYRLFVNNVAFELAEKWGLVSSSALPFLDSTDDRFATMMIYNVFVSFGTSVLMYSNKMSTISPEIIESAQLDGAGALREFFHIVLPMTFSTISVFLITGIAGIFTNQINHFAFFAAAPNAYDETRTIGYLLYHRTRKAGQNDWEYPSIAALGILLTLIVLPLTFLARYCFERFGPSEE
jgi:ABC-type sugar transport system permease subunit